MKYFENAKRDYKALDAILKSDGSNFSIGFKCADAYTDNIESKNSYVARVSAAYDRHVEFANVLKREDFNSILVFAPESERCYCGCWRMNHNTPEWNYDRWLYECKCGHGNFHSNDEFPA